jgi:phosphohistidine phosphatase
MLSGSRRSSGPPWASAVRAAEAPRLPGRRSSSGRLKKECVRSFMKTLLLVRHAKSSRDPPGLPDEDRPLAGRGERDAPKMGQRLAKRDVEPDLILSSPASRALATAKLFAAKLHYKPKGIVVERRLCPGRLEELLAMIEELDDKLDTVMLFGHNRSIASACTPSITHRRAVADLCRRRARIRHPIVAEAAQGSAATHGSRLSQEIVGGSDSYTPGVDDLRWHHEAHL